MRCSERRLKDMRGVAKFILSTKNKEAREDFLLDKGQCLKLAELDHADHMSGSQ